MTPERWRRLEALFEQALEVPDAERDGFVDRACAGDDAELRGELRALLADAPLTWALGDVIAAEAQVLASDAVTAQVGRRIGPFRLLALLGEGGMGAVYLAERDDAQFAHRVAIKILSHAVGSQAIARFRDE